MKIGLLDGKNDPGAALFFSLKVPLIPRVGIMCGLFMNAALFASSNFAAGTDVSNNYIDYRYTHTHIYIYIYILSLCKYLRIMREAPNSRCSAGHAIIGGLSRGCTLPVVSL